jgi:hypothetical protein
MQRVFFAALLASFALLAGGCKAKTDNKDAIRDGVLKHIAGMNGLNVNNMTITVTKATVSGDKAQADVDIRAKNGDPSAPPMQVSYELEKQGGQWVVLKGQATGGMQHPAPGSMPPQGAMPPGHPQTGGTSGQMPADHPDFNAILNSTQSQQQQQSGSQPSTTPPASNAKP